MALRQVPHQHVSRAHQLNRIAFPAALVLVVLFEGLYYLISIYRYTPLNPPSLVYTCCAVSVWQFRRHHPTVVSRPAEVHCHVQGS